MRWLGVIGVLIGVAMAAPVLAWRHPAPDAARQAAGLADFSTNSWRKMAVARVIDGDTIVLVDGVHVRLLDINCPEISHPEYADAKPGEPFGQTAKARTAQLVAGREIWLQTGRKLTDAYGRLLAELFVPGPQGGPQVWVNGTLVREGLATVYTFADDALYPAPLLGYEQAARVAKQGMWTLPRWRLRDAATCCGAEDIGTFNVVQGRVLRVEQVDEKWYLNFGKDYRTDFTVEITAKDFENNFTAAGVQDLRQAYQGKTVRVHGVLKPIDGVMVKVTHPAQIEVIGK